VKIEGSLWSWKRRTFVKKARVKKRKRLRSETRDASRVAKSKDRIATTRDRIHSESIKRRQTNRAFRRTGERQVPTITHESCMNTEIRQLPARKE
jgi:hypothetical protein